MLFISKDRGKLDSGLCTFAVLAKKMLLIQNRVWPQYPLKVGTAQQHYFCKFRESAQTSRFDFLLHFDMRNIFQICTEK